MSNSDENPSRFWELYILRYSVGAILGALILFFLAKQNTQISNLIFIKPTEPIDIIQVGIFLAVGLLYSYLASAPILVFHTGRFLLPKPSNSSLSRSTARTVAFLISNLIPPLLFFFNTSMSTTPKYWFSTVIFISCIIISSQIIIILKCQTQRSDQFRFYKRLAINRSQSKGGLVESYRHLREHGNAFLIIIFEIVLGMILFAATMHPTFSETGKSMETYEVAANLATVLTAWISPAAIVWLIACYIEQDFVES